MAPPSPKASARQARLCPGLRHGKPAIELAQGLMFGRAAAHRAALRPQIKNQNPKIKIPLAAPKPRAKAGLSFFETVTRSGWT
jgi:hypothetical protein